MGVRSTSAGGARFKIASVALCGRWFPTGVLGGASITPLPSDSGASKSFFCRGHFAFPPRSDPRRRWRGRSVGLRGQGITKPLNRLHRRTARSSNANRFEADATDALLGPTIERGDVGTLAFSAAGETLGRVGQRECL